MTLKIISARFHTSSAEARIEAPAPVYSESAIPDPTPAPASTTTLWPAAVSDRTPAGTSATRFSLSLISLGSPTIMGLL